MTLASLQTIQSAQKGYDFCVLVFFFSFPSQVHIAVTYKCMLGYHRTTIQRHVLKWKIPLKFIKNTHDRESVC